MDEAGTWHGGRLQPVGEDGAVLVKELPNRSLLLFCQLFRETAYHLLDYVDFGS